MKRERIANAMVFVVVMLFLAFMAGAFQPLELEPETYEVVPPAPDTWEHWFPTVPKPENTPTAFERLAQKLSTFCKKVLETYREGLGGPARSPWWYETHCEYVELDPTDLSPDVPDGIYVNCR